MMADKAPAGKRQQDIVQDLLEESKEDPWLNLVTVATILQVHPSTVGRWVDEGILKHNVIGKLPRVRKSDLLAFIEHTNLSSKDQARVSIEETTEDGN
jgi:excisionase family DNA binding protein